MAIEQIKTQAKQISTQAKKVQDEVATSAHEVFLAGLGAAALVEQEGEKLLQESGKLFDRLVARGKKVEAEGRKKVQEGRKQVVAARKKTEKTVEKLQDNVNGQLTRLVQRLGIPHQDQIKVLSDRVAELTRKIDAMQKTSAAKA
jgi:poly(hydroxyalkanoate) granule-associated protein